MLPTIKCSCSRDVADARPEEPVSSATSFNTCRRICSCGIAYSNAATTDTSKLTKIYSNPFIGLPTYLADDSYRVLNSALNITNRETKKNKFCFSTSEDHVTWTIFKYLQHERALGAAMDRLGIVAGTAKEPELLLWGVPTPESHEGASVAGRIIEVSNSLRESTNSRSEPDVILNFGEQGFVFIEVKLGSRNDLKPYSYSHWDRYLPGGTEYFASPDAAKQSGLYELVRNWRIACALGGNCLVTLVNLGPRSLFEPPHDKPLVELENSLNRKPNRVFRRVAWEDFVNAIPNRPDWLNKYIQERRILDPFAPVGSASL
jgi:hypothetical protein